MPQIIQMINQATDKAISHNHISCYIIASNLSATQIAEIKSIGKMVLVYGKDALDICKKYELDGVVIKIDTSKPLKPQAHPLRDALKKKTLGIVVPARRHEAMLASEVEPEFIIFSSDLSDSDYEVMRWYNELFLLPLAVLPDNNVELKGNIPADFIIAEAKKIKNFDC